ncbi:MarR family transcriptional regulator [Mycoplasmatota bacterium]|nr:MarR family transcriptional regulator [Mycoplasmatota bacterium]
MDNNLLKDKMCLTFLNMKRSFVNELREVGISYQQWNVLKTINSEEDSISAKQLVERLDSDKATISGVLKRLVTAGYVIEKKNPRDKRENLLFISNKSTKLCESISVMEKRFNDRMFHDFTSEDAEVFDLLLDKIEL